MQQISIVLCTYNGEQFIDEQIVSILNQTHSNFELLISDDASTDGTSIKLKDWAERDKRIKLFFQEKNIGFNANFEFVLRKVSMEMIAISDQDDIWHLAKLEKMLRHWNTSCPIIHCDSRRFIGNISNLVHRSKSYTRFTGKDSKKLFFFNSINGHALIIRRNLLEKVLPFEKEIFYDWWTALVASCNGGVDYVNEILVYQRVHEKNASIDKQENPKESFLVYREQVKNHIRKFITAPNILDEDKRLGLQFVKHLSSLHNFQSKWKLFFLMMRYRKFIFYYKQKPINLLSHFKHSLKWAFS
jgi:glycosyltransferase involved in cell wall biosynthesis